jgi:hypothetical protein
MRLLKRLCYVGLLAALCFATVVHAQAPVAAPLAVLGLSPLAGGLLTVNVNVAGHSALMLFDTGAGETVIGKDLVARIGCTPYGQFTGFRQNGQRLDLPRCGSVVFDVGGVPLEGYTAVFDVTELPDWPPEFPSVDGTLALPATNVEPFTLDLSGRKVYLESRASLAARTQGLVPSPIRLQLDDRGRAVDIFLQVAAHPEPLWFLMDSGNILGTVMAPHAFESLGRPRPSVGTQTAASLVVGGQPYFDNAVAVEDSIYDGVLGVAFLNRYVVTIDMQAMQAWIVPK